MKITEAKRDSIVSKLKQDIDAANAYYEDTVEPTVMERYAIFKADKGYYRKMFPRLSQCCEIVSTDVQDTIESTMPVLIFQSTHPRRVRLPIRRKSGCATNNFNPRTHEGCDVISVRPISCA